MTKSKTKTPKQDLAGMQQTVWLEFNDGTRAGFTGPAIAAEGDTRRVVGIEFTRPSPLPPGYSFEEVPKL